VKTVKTGNEELSLAGAKSQANRVQMKRMASRYPGHQLDVRQIAARQYVLLTKAPSSKPQAPSRRGGAGGNAKSPSVRQYVTLTQDVVVWLLGYSLKKNVDNLNYFILFNNGPWYNVILTIKKEKDETRRRKIQ